MASSPSFLTHEEVRGADTSYLNLHLGAQEGQDHRFESPKQGEWDFDPVTCFK